MMKTIFKLFLFLSMPVLAQTPLLNSTKIVSEWTNVTVPPGLSMTAQLGCPQNGNTPAAWSKPVVISGTVQNNWFNLGLTAEPKCGGVLPALWVQSGAAAATLTILTTPSTTIVVPAVATGSITLPVPINGTCTWTGTSSNGSTLVITLTCTSP